ncbi:MAG TPA: 30S ribosome-binding factor RbfA [Bacillota bacterium]|nr:30S ribosome-binding factor RbfA [Bacillota bacterium]HOL09367.1 30S ribosome-binding factor RbfA [Bacillota bacterium]HPO97084.1 30S ribosome-binding factor RbfA [Bacillota bacterium]
MAEHRAERLRELVKEEFGQMLQRDLKDPRIGFVSVTDAEVSNDYSHVKIFVSILGDEEAKKATMEGLESAKGFIRTELGKRIRLRYTPEVHIIADDSMERGSRIMKLLNEVKNEQRGES